MQSQLKPTIISRQVGLELTGIAAELIAERYAWIYYLCSLTGFIRYIYSCQLMYESTPLAINVTTFLSIDLAVLISVSEK